MRVLRGVGPDGRAAQRGVRQRSEAAVRHRVLPARPDPQWVYVGNTDSVWRFPYRNGDLHRARPATRSSTTRSPAAAGCAAAATGRATSPSPPTARRCTCRSARARTTTTPTTTRPSSTAPTSSRSTPTGPACASTPGASATRSASRSTRARGELWTSVNERDRLGDDLVPDYITHVKDGGFYGWPWYYIGGNIDPRHAGKHPELRDKVIVPDVLLQSHHASLRADVLRRQAVPRRVRGRHLRRAARLVEPRAAHRLQRRRACRCTRPGTPPASTRTS